MVFSRFLRSEPKIKSCPPEICKSETKAFEVSQNENMPEVQDWDLVLEQLKWNLWVSLDSILGQKRISGKSREALLDLNEEVTNFPVSSQLRNKFSIKPLE